MSDREQALVDALANLTVELLDWGRDHLWPHAPDMSGIRKLCYPSSRRMVDALDAAGVALAHHRGTGEETCRDRDALIAILSHIAPSRIAECAEAEGITAETAARLARDAGWEFGASMFNWPTPADPCA